MNQNSGSVYVILFEIALVKKTNAEINAEIPRQMKGFFRPNMLLSAFKQIIDESR
ncbi:MAG: hypothetical protein II969_06525 [Anaerolineaceae bacterium]|nr:hypothetical protein [Anaerolineaceae bacterium]